MKRSDAADLAGSTAVGSLVALVLLSLTVTGRGGAGLFGDADLLTWSVAHRPAAALAVARGLTYTGTGITPYVLVVLAGLVLGRTARQRILAAGACLVCLAAGQAVRHGVMSLVTRPRPETEEWATHASGWSFPSGHTTTSAITAGLLIVAVLVRAPRGRRTLAFVIGSWAVLVALTRVYLGVHWFSDILGGWLFSLCWLSLGVYVVARFVPRAYTATAEPGLRTDGTAKDSRDESPARSEAAPQPASETRRLGRGLGLSRLRGRAVNRAVAAPPGHDPHSRRP